LEVHVFTITDKAAEKAKLVLAEEGKAEWGSGFTMPAEDAAVLLSALI